MKRLSKSLAETNSLAREILSHLSRGDGATVVALSGDLGGGKTAFVKALAKALGVTDPVTSPTFVLEKVYKLGGAQYEHLIHIDAYRLDSGAELSHLGWGEISANPANLICLEWPERVADLIPPHAKKVACRFVDETTREYEIS